MKFKNFIKIFFAILFVFVSTHSYAKTIKWSMQGDSLTLDPHAQNEGPTTQVSRQVYEALVTRGLDMSIEPQLATDWKTTDPNTWVFNLRKGVKFSDGTDMTAKDVVFSILRAKQPTSDFKEYISTISDVKEIDNYTVQVTTSKPNPILLNQLSNIFIMSKKWSIDFGATVSQNWDGGEETFSATNAMGTGPFKITLREPNTKTVFERNSNWWGSMKDNSVSEIHLLPIKNSATRVAALLSGEVDLVTDAPVQDLARIGNSADHDVVSTAQMRTIFLGMDQAADKLRSGNTGDNPFKKKEVRQALYQAIDIEAIKKKVMRGLSEPAGIITFPGVNGYTKDLDKRLPYDVDAAKKLLADAGYPKGFDVELRCPNDRYVNDEAICTAVVGMLGKIGVNVNLFAQTKSKHFKELKEDKGDFYMLGWGVPTLDSHYVFHYLYESGASWNKVNFSNSEVDAAIRVMEGEVDLDKRNAAIANAWKIVKDDISYLPLHHQVISWATKNSVDVPIRPNNEPLFRFASFK
ncbi:peptide ABC transporter substrate-binding protein [Pelagibacteraceae bacterium GOM-A3]|nr:peptide ABC transporter substrate-binding protein [Pelagibacteraceae bacterium GOM-A3]